MLNYVVSVYLDRIRRCGWLVLSFIIRYFVKIEKGRVCCWAYSFKQYGCSPRYITEYILDECPEMFDIYWVFNKGVDIQDMDDRIHIVYNKTLRFLVKVYSSEFVITNSRNDLFGNFFIKKKRQIYIQTWHGSFPLKKIEKDAEIELGPIYVRRAKADSRICNLMLSNSDFFTNLIRKSFWYDGEILQKGIPRNDIFFNKEKTISLRREISLKNGLNPNETFFVLYAPTFRNDGKSDHFKLNWSVIIDLFEKKFQKDVRLFLRLHPNSLGLIDLKSLIKDNRIINMCYYPDMQELLCVADILITDYSSSMFDIALLNKPCFLYADDVNSYDRGLYFNLKKLPFAFADNEDKLLQNIKNFNIESYLLNLNRFKNDVMKVCEDGHASESVVNWMKAHK